MFYITFITDSMNFIHYGKKNVSFCLDQIQYVYTTARLGQLIQLAGKSMALLLNVMLVTHQRNI
jgi:hypothetical protein